MTNFCFILDEKLPQMVFSPWSGWWRAPAWHWARGYSTDPAEPWDTSDAPHLAERERWRELQFRSSSSNVSWLTPSDTIFRDFKKRREKKKKKTKFQPCHAWSSPHTSDSCRLEMRRCTSSSTRRSLRCRLPGSLLLRHWGGITEAVKPTDTHGTTSEYNWAITWEVIEVLGEQKLHLWVCIPISVNKDSFENGVHHVFNFILIFL